jgi:hypothetical protein
MRLRLTVMGGERRPLRWRERAPGPGVFDRLLDVRRRRDLLGGLGPQLDQFLLLAGDPPGVVAVEPDLGGPALQLLRPWPRPRGERAGYPRQQAVSGALRALRSLVPPPGGERALCFGDRDA